MYLWHCHFSLWEEMDVDKEDISSVKISSLFMLNSLWFFFDALMWLGVAKTLQSYKVYMASLLLNKWKLMEAGY